MCVESCRQSSHINSASLFDAKTMKVASPTLLLLAALAVGHQHVNGFVPSSTFVNPSLASSMASQKIPLGAPTRSSLSMIDPSAFAETTSSFFNSFGTTDLLAFTDQGQNLAGTFFQASLLPYLVFLYFLGFRGNRISDLGNFGFQFILFFVLTTIPSGIISKSVYGTSLANVDYLHGGAELLLTLSTLLIVSASQWHEATALFDSTKLCSNTISSLLTHIYVQCIGFKEASTNPNPPPVSKGRNLALAVGIGFAALCAAGPQIPLDVHAPFLFGIGNLSPDTVLSLPWVSHTEPENALSIPTWAIHFSSVIEYVVAMRLVWEYAETTENPTWKGLTWGMFPLHMSGICACTYHFFYNPSVLQFLVSMQAGFTLLGNITCAIAAYRIARSNGWTLDEVNPLPKSDTNPSGLMVDAIAALPLVKQEPKESNTQLAIKLAVATFATSYIVKYGELGLDFPFTPNAATALAIALGIPAITGVYYYNKGKQETGEGFSLSIPGFGGDSEGGLSMDDVKKYGVAGTVAYVLTELAFWAVAFPVASTALYQSTGHWPDVINDPTDRATVLGFIFAGANIARLLVPVRLGAALALAPWVDDNILSRMNQGGEMKSANIPETAPSTEQD